MRVPTMLRGRRVSRLMLLDVVVAAGLTAGGLVDVSSLRGPPSAAAVLLAVTCTATVAVRRQAPASMAVIAVTSMAIYQANTHDPRMTFEPYAVLFCFYLAGRYAKDKPDHRRRWALLTLALVAMSFCFTSTGGKRFADVLSAWAVFSVVPFVIGELIARRSAMTVELADNLRQLRVEQEHRIRGAVTDERNRVARELHDVIAHCVSVMVIQAGAARLVAVRDKAAAVEALRVVGVSGREAMIDLRRITGVVHRDELDRNNCALGVSRLDELVTHAREAGTPTRLRIAESVQQLPPELDVAVYRLVQEALTNVAKHARSARVDVDVSLDRGMVEVRVKNSVPVQRSIGSSIPGSGQGLVGMRERVALCGGEIQTGLNPDGGYTVFARLPLTPGPPPTPAPLTRRPGRDEPIVTARSSVRSWCAQRMDPLLAGGWLVVMVAEAALSKHRHGPVAFNVVVVAAMAVAGLWRRRAPLLFLIVVGLLSLLLSQGLTSGNYATITGIYSLVVPVYAIAAWQTRTRALAGLILFVVAATIVGVVQGSHLSGLIGPLLGGGAVWSVGRVVRAYRELATNLTEISIRLAAEREDGYRLAVANERAQITRDLHAVVARDVIAMIIQADMAGRLLDGDPVRAALAMATIEDTGRGALVQLRRILGVLRDRRNDRELRPQPGLSQIESLVERARQRGQRVDFAVDGEPHAASAGVDLIAYRILEEALSETAEPGRGTIMVSLRFGEDRVEIVLTNAEAAKGWPTTGMLERVAICNGHVSLTEGSRMTIRLPRQPQEALA